MIYQTGDAELYYAASGEGPNLVLLHPTPVHHRFWLPMVYALPGYRAILPDLRGHGRSQLGTELLSITTLASDVLQLLDRLEIEKALFCGCSIGGYILYELWRRAPERVAGLAVFCSKPQADSAGNKAKRQETIAQIHAHGIDQFFDSMSQSLLGPSARSSKPHLVAAVREMMTMEPEAVIAVQRALGERVDSAATARTISVPLLAVAGGEDSSSTPEEMEVLALAADNAEYRVMDGAGHYAPIEQPERAAALLHKFLQRCG